jgi:3-deoxy-D-manno-octulosonic-acid transferase
VYRILDACGGALQVESKEELYEKLNFLLERSDIRNQMGTDALKSVQKMRGATARTMEFVENQIRSAHPLLSKV